jgi:hypothetical protein
MRECVCGDYNLKPQFVVNWPMHTHNNEYVVIWHFTENKSGDKKVASFPLLSIEPGIML